MKENELISEFGSISPIGFARAKVYDADGNEIVIPKCEKCGNYKGQVVGKETFAWVCIMCIDE